MSETTATDPPVKDKAIPEKLVIGSFEADFSDHTIRNGGEETHLEPRVMSLLWYIAQRPGEVIQRSELETEVWKDVVVGYDALNIAIGKLRKAFNDDSRNPTFIETIPKVGYRLVASVQQQESKVSPGHATPSSATASIDPPTFPWRVTISGLILLLVVGLLAWFKPWSQDVYPELPDMPSLVVLPLKDLSPEAGNDPLPDAISEGITSGLSRFPDLFVISSDSANAYRNGSKTPKQIGRELGVQYVLTGNVQRAGNQLRVNMQLVNADRQSSVWASDYASDLKDVFVIQDEIIHSVTTTLGETIWQSAAENLAALPLEDYAAFDYFLQAKQAFHGLTSKTNQDARRLLDNAMEADPDFGLAYLLMAWSYYLEFRAQWEDTDPEALDKAMEYVREAEKRMGRSHEIHRLVAKINQVSGNFDQALVHSEMALELNPNDGDLLATHAQMLTRSGESKEAQVWIRGAMRRNPHYPPWYAAVLSIAQYLQRDYAGSVNTLSQVNDLPVWGLRYLIASYGQLGMTDESQEPIRLLLEQSPDFTVSGFGNRLEFRLDSDKQLFLDGLLKAGLPP